jgi:hypothetical protein
MKFGKLNASKIGAACLFVTGIILVFYALFVPAFVRGVHWLITLVAILFLVAIPALYDSTRRANKIAARGIAVLFAFGMIVIIVADLLFALSFLATVDHDLVYVLGNSVFVTGVLIFGLVTLKAVFQRWVAYLSIITGIVGLATNLPQQSSLLSTFSLLLLGLWSVAVGFNIHKLAKSGYRRKR